MKTKFDSYVNQFKALLSGDTDTAQAEKTWQQSVTTLKAHIATLKSETPDFESVVDEAKEAKRLAVLNNGKQIANKEGRVQYVRNLRDAENTLRDAQDALNVHNDSLKFYEDELALLQDTDDVTS